MKGKLIASKNSPRGCKVTDLFAFLGTLSPFPSATVVVVQCQVLVIDTDWFLLVYPGLLLPDLPVCLSRCAPPIQLFFTSNRFRASIYLLRDTQSVFGVSPGHLLTCSFTYMEDVLWNSKGTFMNEEEICCSNSAAARGEFATYLHINKCEILPTVACNERRSGCALPCLDSIAFLSRVLRQQYHLHQPTTYCLSNRHFCAARGEAKRKEEGKGAQV